MKYELKINGQTVGTIESTDNFNPAEEIILLANALCNAQESRTNSNKTEQKFAPHCTNESDKV